MKAIHKLLIIFLILILLINSFRRRKIRETFANTSTNPSVTKKSISIPIPVKTTSSVTCNPSNTIVSFDPNVMNILNKNSDIKSVSKENSVVSFDPNVMNLLKKNYNTNVNKNTVVSFDPNVMSILNKNSSNKINAVVSFDPSIMNILKKNSVISLNKNQNQNQNTVISFDPSVMNILKKIANSSELLNKKMDKIIDTQTFEDPSK